MDTFLEDTVTKYIKDSNNMSKCSNCLTHMPFPDLLKHGYQCFANFITCAFCKGLLLKNDQEAHNTRCLVKRAQSSVIPEVTAANVVVASKIPEKKPEEVKMEIKKPIPTNSNFPFNFSKIMTMGHTEPVKANITTTTTTNTTTTTKQNSKIDVPLSVKPLKSKKLEPVAVAAAPTKETITTTDNDNDNNIPLAQLVSKEDKYLLEFLEDNIKRQWIWAKYPSEPEWSDGEDALILREKILYGNNKKFAVKLAVDFIRQKWEGYTPIESGPDEKEPTNNNNNNNKRKHDDPLTNEVEQLKKRIKHIEDGLINNKKEEKKTEAPVTNNEFPLIELYQELLTRDAKAIATRIISKRYASIDELAVILKVLPQHLKEYINNPTRSFKPELRAAVANWLKSPQAKAFRDSEIDLKYH